jgi:hypothetical protein
MAVPLHVPPLQLSPEVHMSPSLHEAELSFDQVLWLLPGVHTWHGLLGLEAPAAKQLPPMKQLPLSTDQADWVRPGSQLRQLLGPCCPLVRQTPPIEQQVAPQQTALAGGDQNNTPDAGKTQANDVQYDNQRLRLIEVLPVPLRLGAHHVTLLCALARP